MVLLAQSSVPDRSDSGHVGDTQYGQDKGITTLCGFGPPASSDVSQLPELPMPEIVFLWFGERYRNKSKIYND